ncbi:hypothetical protein MP638_000423 [Amoeboaphelidium occidentale]|nr:hypothetical protein MP638_000423 [Amoeboaphelidium occidentale]
MDTPNEHINDEVLSVEKVPMVHPYPKNLDNYYVRPTYRTSFTKICKMLFDPSDEIDYISISGTPGIGKSVFYMYTFRKMREKYPDATIILASFASGRLEEAQLFLPESKNAQLLNLNQLEQADLNYPGALHLYDGAPTKIPKNLDAKMLVFTSPNEGWFNAVRKYHNHEKLYMDFWTYNELKCADRFLKLNIGPEELQRRFGHVGGVARHCLASDRVYRNSIKDIDDAIGKFSSVSELQKCLTGDSVHTVVSHRLLHFRVKADDSSDYEVEFGSNYIKQKLAARFRDMVRSERATSIHALEFVPKGSQMRGWLFESCVHDSLSKGGEFKLSSLSNPGSTKTIKIDPTVDKLDNNESIDSWHLSTADKKLILIQATVSADHPIKARGVWSCLKRRLNILEEFTDGRLEVILVFIVPENLAGSFKLQHIMMRSIPKLENLESMSLTEIDGIGKTKADKLKEKDILTAQQLYDILKENDILTAQQLYDIVNNNPDDKRIKSVKKVSEDFVELIRERPVLERICKIEQFVLGINTK